MQEILESFDKKEMTGFPEYQVSRELGKHADTLKEVGNELLYEISAFDFAEHTSEAPGPWGTHFGPKMQRKDDNGFSEYPSITQVTEATIRYWKERSEKAINPILRARYKGLVYDFEKLITGNTTDHKMVTSYIDDLLEIVEGQFTNVPANIYVKLKRALSVALLINSQDHIKRIKDTVFALKIDSKYKNDGKWEFAFDNLVLNRKITLSADELQLVISKLQEKMANATSDQNQKADPWIAERYAMRLAGFYRKTGKEDEVRKTIFDLGNSFHAALENVAGMQAVHWLEHLHKIYISFQFHKEAEELLVLIRKNGERAAAEMGQIPFEFEISEAEFKAYVDDMLSGSEQDILMKIARQYIPNQEEAKKQITKISKIAPTQFILGKTLMDSKGRTVAKIGSLETDPDGHIIDQISQTMLLSSIFLRRVFEGGVERKTINVNGLLEYLKSSPVISEDRMPILEMALSAFISGNSVVCIHLLIPQIEEAIRNTLEKLGGAVLRPAKNSSGYVLRTLDDILRDPLLLDLLGIDLLSYFRILLTDQRGWNLRNNVCHGMANYRSFNNANADRALHALLCIGLINK